MLLSDLVMTYWMMMMRILAQENGNWQVKEDEDAWEHDIITSTSRVYGVKLLIRKRIVEFNIITLMFSTTQKQVHVTST